MALLAAYMVNKAEGEALEDYLQNRYFRISGLACSPTRLIRRIRCFPGKLQIVPAVEQAAVEH